MDRASAVTSDGSIDIQARLGWCWSLSFVRNQHMAVITGHGDRVSDHVAISSGWMAGDGTKPILQTVASSVENDTEVSVQRIGVDIVRKEFLDEDGGV